MRPIRYDKREIEKYVREGYWDKTILPDYWDKSDRKGPDYYGRRDMEEL